jgi:VanZ family protein
VAAVGVLSVLPAEVIPKAFHFWDKAQHALGFAVLALIGLLAYGEHRRRVVLALLGYGALIELVQGLVPWRYGDVGDFAADAVGVVIGAV